MPIPEPFRADLAAFPAALRALVEAELAAGNEIVAVGGGWPAPPIGAQLRLSGPVTTRPRASGDGIVFRARDCSLHAGEFTDAAGVYFVLEPPLPPPPEPDMDAIRAAHSGTARAASSPPPQAPAPGPVERFERSLNLGYDQWRDGIGFDVDAIRAASPAERDRIEAILLARGIDDWREVEALAALDTPAARAALRKAARQGNGRVRNAVVEYAPDLVPEAQRVANLIASLRDDEIFSGLTQTLDAVAGFHPPPIVDALFAGALRRPGEVAVHLAAMLLYVHGKADAPFDWAQRPFLLRFHAEPGSAERIAAFRELCARLGVAAEPHLAR